jgi:hypothetical protein
MGHSDPGTLGGQAMGDDNQSAALDAATLKLRFKKHCVGAPRTPDNWRIRVHRALSWYKRVVELPADQPEAQFLFCWIAFNSLFSRWDAERNAPGADSQARNTFLARLLQIDTGKNIPQMLHQHRGLVRKLLGNPYLSSVFWRDPHHPKARGWATEDANYLEKNFRDHNYIRLMGQAFDRLYVLRGQLVHGASTGGSRLNRTTLNYCLKAMEEFLPVILLVVIDHGDTDEWPELSYPPVA